MLMCKSCLSEKVVKMMCVHGKQHYKRQVLCLILGSTVHIHYNNII